MTKLDKRDRSDLLRRRLTEAMGARGLSQAALARAVAADRSTVSQLLSGHGARLPNAQLVAECARALGVSSDWLLGLSDHAAPATELLAGQIEMTEAARTAGDEQIFAWHAEAAGYKIRHVPARFPDMLKTDEMLEWEYAPHIGRTTEQAIGASRDRLENLRAGRSDYEIAMPLFELGALVSRTGYYSGLPDEVAAGQVRHLLALHEAHFPTIRVFLFDARRVHSAPLTVFGPLLAVLYLGQHYLAFRDTDRVTALSRQFDRLVREASVGDRDLPVHVRAVAGKAGVL